MRPTAALLLLLALAGAPAAPAVAQTAQPPRGVLPPQPGSATQQPAAPPTTPVPQAAATATPPPASEVEPTPSELVLGAPIYPGATFLRSFSAGQGQRYYLFGTNDSYAQVVAFYRQALKSRGSEVYDVPPVWTFDLGRFREESMAYPPSVVVRDHMAGGQRGYLHAAGTEAQRYATIVQMVPPPPGTRR